MSRSLETASKGTGLLQLLLRRLGEQLKSKDLKLAAFHGEMMTLKEIVTIQVYLACEVSQERPR